MSHGRQACPWGRVSGLNDTKAPARKRRGLRQFGGGGGNRTRVRERLHENFYVRSPSSCSHRSFHRGAGGWSGQPLCCLAPTSSGTTWRPARVSDAPSRPHGQNRAERVYLVSRRMPVCSRQLKSPRLFYEPTGPRHAIRVSLALVETGSPPHPGIKERPKHVHGHKAYNAP